jgi:S-adenosylmethionine synthetase
VSWGHPDKICDQISDAIVTDCLKNDKSSRVAAECLIKDYDILIAGEISSNHEPDYYKLVSEVLNKIGLENIDKYKINVNISKQSKDIALGVDNNKGAGDQGMMFGYATRETPEFLPVPFAVSTYALKMLRDIKSPMLLPDAKSQVSYDYYKGKITTFLISTQHKEEYTINDITPIVEDAMIKAAKKYGLNSDFKKLVNPTGRFVTGSSFADSGLTGRKIIADTYGGICRHGGGAFSGKDPTKVDRSGAYIARKIAKDIVKFEYAERCEIQIAYAIGVAEPVSLNIECFETEHVPISLIKDYINSNYDLTPAGIIKNLDLLNVDYNLVSSYGHFGKEYLPWEK